MVCLIIWPLAEARNVHVLVENDISKHFFLMILCFHLSFRPKPECTEVHKSYVRSCLSGHTSIFICASSTVEIPLVTVMHSFSALLGCCRHSGKCMQGRKRASTMVNTMINSYMWSILLLLLP